MQPPNLLSSRRWLLTVVAVMAVSLIATVLAPIASAQSQNEVLINVLYDGTPDFDITDPASPSGALPEAHTPGQDGGSNNLVVRTWDQFAVRVDWNVNEADATNVVLEVVLPAEARWTPDTTGMFGGCDPALSSFLDDQTLLCSLGDQPEGSNGAIRPVAQLTEALDNSTFDVVATLKTDADLGGVSDGLDQELTVSEAPNLDYEKVNLAVSDVIDAGNGPGRVFFFPFAVYDGSQSTDPVIGVGPILDSAGFNFYDHMWNMTSSARVATQAEMDAAEALDPIFFGSPCGVYEGTGSYIANQGTWTCGAETNPNGYNVVPIQVTGFTSRPYPVNLADGSLNNPDNPMVATGQIAIWVDEGSPADPPGTSIQGEIANPDNDSNVSAKFDNSITQLDDATLIADGADAIEAQSNGTSGPSTGGSPANNTASVVFGPTGNSGGSGWNNLIHDIHFERGPLQLVQSTTFGEPRYYIDKRSTANGGLGNIMNRDDNGHTTPAGDDAIGEVARGQILTITSEVFFNNINGDVPEAPVHGCVSFDTTHYNLIAMDEILVSDVGSGSTIFVPAIGAWTIQPNAGIAHVLTGNQEDWWLGNGRTLQSTGGDEFPFTLEFGSAPIPQVFGYESDNLTCNDADATWVDATDAAGMAGFDTVTPGDGVYEGITRARFSSDTISWDSASAQGLHGLFQVQVKQDFDDQTDDQELFAVMSHSWGEFDGGVPTLDVYPGTDDNDCLPIDPGDWSLGGNDTASTTGWCHNRFFDEGPTSLNTDDVVDWDNKASVVSAGLNGSGALVKIVSAQLDLAKSNLDGVSDVKDNGQLVQFSLNPSIVGSSLEALSNVSLVDDLEDYYEFVRFVKPPSTPGATCTENAGLINCQFSAPDPANPDVMAPGLPGGWSDEVIIEVMVTGAIANPDSPTVLQNEATASSSGLGPWDAEIGNFSAPVVLADQEVTRLAYSYMPLPADEGAIIKAVETLEGPCVAHPTDDPVPAGWAERCSMIDFEGDMSFVLSLSNQGNTAFTNIEIVDVFPHGADEVEPVSATPGQGGSPSTLGDGRTPPSDFEGDLDFVEMVPISAPGQTFVLVTGDDPSTISRDPERTKSTVTWCLDDVVVFGTGPCPIADTDVTATFTFIQGPLNPGQTVELGLTLDSQGHECDDIYTNTFGARVDQLFLPIRSNDVSIMVNCEFDLALRKTIADDWTPGPDWLAPGTSKVDFLIEVTNQGDPVNNFEVTDYVDPAMFTFDINDNLGGNTTGDVVLPYVWDNSGAHPVVTVNDPNHPTSNPNSNLIVNGDRIFIPITLTVSPSYEPADDLSNTAEISYFDSDANPANGDSADGTLADVDSLPDGSDGDPLVDDVIDNSNGDEDDHDIAVIPVFDVAIDKLNPTISQTVDGDWVATFDIQVINDSNVAVTNVIVRESPPAGLTFASATTGAATTLVGNTASITGGPTTFTVDILQADDAVTFTVTYDVTDLTVGPYVNSVQIDAFADAVGDTQTDVDSAPGNDVDNTQRDEDDDDVEQVSLPFDLALIKKPVVDNPGYTDILDGVQNGDEILFEVEVFNQLATVEDFDIIDYLSAGWTFDLSAQVSPLFTTGDVTLPYTWDASGGDPIARIDGVLPAGESVVIPIVLTAAIPSDPTTPLRNVAEILRFDDDGDPTNGDSTDGTVTDIDSTPDGDQFDDPLVDDESNDDGTLDEDDHDEALTVWFDASLEKQIFDGTGCVEGPLAVTPATAQMTYCLTVTNDGPTDLTNVSFVDTPPDGLVNPTEVLVPGVTGAAGSYTASLLTPGQSLTIQVTYDLDLGLMTSGSLNNVAEVTAMFDEDGNPAADVDSFVDAVPDNDMPTEDDEDLQTITVPSDLALTKTLGPIVGDQVTMFINVTNQSVAVTTLEVTDYVDPAMWETFSLALNPPAAATGPASPYGYSWDISDPDNPVAMISPVTAGDAFANGETMTIPIVLEINETFSGTVLDNHAEISNFDDDGDPSNGDASDGTLVDLDSTPDGDDGNGAGETFNSVDDEVDEDGTAGGDEDDHDGVLVPIYDLALSKTFDASTVQSISPGDDVTFLVTLVNQGTTWATDPVVIDYVDLSFFEPFDDANNGPTGTTGGDQALSYTWAPAGTDGELSIAGSFGPGESITVPVTLTVVAAPAVSTLTNTAEITDGFASDEAGNETLGSAGESLNDRDSMPDATNDDPFVDDEINDDGTVDEDDHDIAEITLGVQDVPLVFDLALRKTRLTTTSDDLQTFNIAVFNQGTATAVDMTIIDYMPDGMVLNDDDWTAVPGANHAAYELAGPLEPGDSIVIPIDVRVTGNGPFRNLAGITQASAVHPETGEPLDVTDVDSTFGDSQADPVLDNVIDNASGDEDDSDIAEFQRAAGATVGTTRTTTTTLVYDPMPRGFAGAGQSTTREGPAPTGPLAYTGASSRELLQVGLLLILGGAALVFDARRRRRSCDDGGLDLDWESMN